MRIIEIILITKRAITPTYFYRENLIMNKKNEANEQLDINEQILVNNEVMAYRKRFETICKRREKWEQTVFSTANKGLYEMLADLYKIYEEMNDDDRAIERNRAWLAKDAKRREIPFKRNNPSLIELLVKVAFTGTVKDSKRISTYVRVLDVIANTEGVYAADIPKWIEEHGGIEQIRQQTAKNTATKTERFEEGKEIVNEAETLASVTINEANAYVFYNVNMPVVLVGILKAGGVIDIKHICVEKEEGSSITGKTAINTALANVYSKNKNKQKKEAPLKESEGNAKKVEEAEDSIIDEAIKSHDTFDTKEAEKLLMKAAVRSKDVYKIKEAIEAARQLRNKQCAV